MNQFNPQQPYFNPIQRQHLTEDELDKPIKVCKIKVWGRYTKREGSRNDVFEAHFRDQFVEVPVNYNKGHVKLAVNRMVKKELQGIRALEFFIEADHQPEILEHGRRVRDFISDRGIRDNNRLKREYDKLVAERQAEMDRMAGGGAPPKFSDDTQYDNAGLAPFNDDKTYIV